MAIPPFSSPPPKTNVAGTGISIVNGASTSTISLTNGVQSTTAPTKQIFTSGSGTYTTPTNPAPLYIKVRMAGGGGGGGGTSSVGAITAGSSGASTTFGSILTAGGGGGGGTYAGTGGTNTVTGVTALINQAGTSGQGSVQQDASGGTFLNGAIGGENPLGGGGLGSQIGASAGFAALANTGGGGGGAATNQASNYAGGAGGGAGGYIEAIITSPSSTYGYSVGTGGSGGSTTYSGGNGGSGIIIVEEYYGTFGSAVTASASYAQAYFTGTSSWSTSSTSFTDPTNSGGNTLTVRQSNNITLTAASSSLPGITFTPASANAVYLITASFSTNNNTSNDGVYSRLYDGTTEIARSGGSGNTGTSANATYPTMLSGVYVPGTTSAVTVKVQLAAASGGTALITTPYTSANGSAIEWTVQRIDSVAVSGGGGSGTVTSVGFSDTSTTPIYTIGSTPVTTSGTITQTLTSQAQNAVFAGPTSGSGQPSFRALVAADIPTGIAITRSISSVSTATNAGSTANTDYVYLVSGTTTLTLPTAVGNTNRYTIKNTGSNTVSIATTSSQTIDGSASPITLPVANDSLDLISDNANWRII